MEKNRQNIGFSRAELIMSKVPQVTLFFWIIKILSTTVGETAADLLSETLNLGLTITTAIMSVLLIGSLIAQFKTKKYIPGVYWLTVVLISVVGTLITDNLTDNLGVPLVVTTLIFAVALAATFTVWFLNEKTLSIHSIFTAKREGFYWLAILFTFAFGTAAGDLVSEGMGMGYAPAIAIFGGLIVLIAISHFYFKLNTVLSFWMVYVLTRPLGASIGDFLSQSKADGGLNLSTVGISAVFLVAILSIIIYLTKSKKDQINETI